MPDISRPTSLDTFVLMEVFRPGFEIRPLIGTNMHVLGDVEGLPNSSKYNPQESPFILRYLGISEYFLAF